VASLLIVWLALYLTDFYYVHAWVSAHIATIAQAFATHGIIGLGGIPIENFAPLTAQPDNYLHWPPFFYYVLSLVPRVFPESIRALHLFMATIAIANAYVMWRIASMYFKPGVAIICGAAFLLMPATIRYGLILLPANLAMLEVSVALLFVLRYLQSADGREKSLNLGISGVAFFLACVTSWEPFLALPGLLLAYLVDRRPEIFRACFCWAVAAFVAGTSILTFYALSDPTFLADLWYIFTYRLGLTQYVPLSTRVHAVEGQLETIDTLNVFSSTLHFFEAYVVRTQVFGGSLGIIGIFALVFTALRRRRSMPNSFAVLVLPLATFWLGWAVIMQGHYIIHEYQMILASPMLAIGVTCLYALLDEALEATKGSSPRETLAMLARLAFPCALLFMGISAAAITVRGDQEAWQLANFGRLIKAEVPADAMVITSEMSMVQTYYSQRHVIRGVPDGAHLERKLGSIREICPDCALYLALRRQNTPKFGEVLARLQPVFQNEDYVVKKFGRAEPGVAP